MVLPAPQTLGGGTPSFLRGTGGWLVALAGSDGNSVVDTAGCTAVALPELAAEEDAPPTRADLAAVLAHGVSVDTPAALERAAAPPLMFASDPARLLVVLGVIDDQGLAPVWRFLAVAD